MLSKIKYKYNSSEAMYISVPSENYSVKWRLLVCILFFSVRGRTIHPIRTIGTEARGRGRQRQKLSEIYRREVVLTWVS